MQNIRTCCEDGEIWDLILAHEGETFTTAKGLAFSYTVKRNKAGRPLGEILFDRKEKSITRATILLAYQRALAVQETEGCVKGPKKLGVFGASYLYPIFLRLGICTGDKIGEKSSCTKEENRVLLSYIQHEEAHTMPRPKGSKNKVKLAKNAPLDTLIAEENAKIAALEEEIQAIEEAISEQTAKLKPLKAELKKAARQLQAYEEQKAREEAAAAAAAVKEALQVKIDELLSDGMSLEDILEKLK